MLFTVLAGLYFLVTFCYQRYFLQKRKKYGALRQDLAPTISNFLFHDSNDPIEEQRHMVELKIRIREQLRYKSFRKVLSEILFDLQKDVSGKTRERLIHLYRELELHNDAIKKLGSWRWENTSKGILELTQMEVKEGYNLIQKYLNDPRKTVRKQAEISVVQLKKEGIKHLLDNARHSISEWQQLKLIEALGTHTGFIPPKFKSWLLSHNNDVVLFALRLIRHYNQKDAEGAITELAKHKHDQIKLEAIQCLKDFNFTTSLPMLKRIFWRVGVAIKIQILDVMAELGDDNEILFLEEVKDKTLNHLVRGKALGAINCIKPDSILPTKDIEAFDGPKLPIEWNQSFDENHRSIHVEYEIEHGDGISPIMRNSIEFMEIEVYDEVEKTQDKTDEELDEYPEVFPEFELNLLDDESNTSLENHIGLVQHSQTFEKPSSAKIEFEEQYKKMSPSEKAKLLDSMVHYGDKREKQFLESIVDLEENSELRFQAFEKLKQLLKSPDEEKEIDLKEGSILPQSQNSIFHQLFEHASDVHSKMVLLKEIAEVGDEKEIPFLESLLEENLHQELLDRAEQCISLLKAKLPEEEKLLFEPLPKNHAFEKAIDSRIPLELLSLKEEIGASNPVDFVEMQPEFDLESTSFPSIESSKTNNNG